jgi:Spy/CpxP family protein refolding chaperone
LKAEWLQMTPDRGKIKALRGDVVKLHEWIRETAAAHRAEVLKILTPEQQAQVPDDGCLFHKPVGLGRR